MKHLFDASLYRFDEAQPSYWEASAPPAEFDAPPLEGDASCDVAIVGGGYTGLAAAYFLARDFGLDARVLEAGHIGWGASGRNGGFCCIGGTKLSPAAQIRRFGRDETRRYYRCQADAVRLVRELGESESIDFQPQGDAEFAVAESDAGYRALLDEAEMLQSLGLETGAHPRDEFREIGYDAPHQHGAISIRPGFGLHPLRYVRGLAAATIRHGATLHAHSEVRAWRRDGGQHRLETARGSLRAPRVILTGNGFMPEHLHAGVYGRPLPLQSAIVTSRPMSSDELRARGWHTQNPAFNARHMFYYYRVLGDGRFMLGGRADHTGRADRAELAFAELRRGIARLWPQFADLDYTHRWRGLVCFAANLRPSIGRMPEDPSVYFAFGYHGNGVNTATWSGREVARWLADPAAGDDVLPRHLPAIIRGRPPRFPLAFLRRQYLRAGLAAWRLRDWLHI